MAVTVEVTVMSASICRTRTVELVYLQLSSLRESLLVSLKLMTTMMNASVDGNATRTSVDRR